MHTRSLVFLFVAVLLLHVLPLSAQQQLNNRSGDSANAFISSTKNICSNDIILYNLRQDPAYTLKEEAMNVAILKAIQRLNATPVTLPVVVHIINQNPNSITDVQVQNGIQDLNDAFSKSGAYAASLGVDTKISFCLAQKDPDGGNTTGITRTKSYFSNNLNMDNEDAKLKNLIQWDPSRFINIWLITNIQAESYADFSCGIWYRLGVGGYATMPPGGTPLDGIVTTGFGRVLAHEMGHYLGLYHTFEGGCYNYDCTANGDRVCDTPPDGSVRPSPSCSNPTNSCTTDTLSNHSNGSFFSDVPDQISNFMDYGNTSCGNQFTQGQADRMMAAINTQRSGLLQDECTRPCSENILASFTRNIPYPVPGDLINFTNTSTPVTNYEWWVNGALMATTANFSYTFNAVGKTKVTLKAYNNAGCFASATDYIIVNCGVAARFYTNKKAIASKANVYTDSIIFTNTSINGQSYQWLISNNQGMVEHVESTSANLTYVFPAPATYFIRLIAINGSCADTTGFYSVPVSDPTADGAPFNMSVLCYQQNKVRVSFCLADYGYAPIPINTPVNFYDADPRLPGANKLSPTFYLPYATPGGNCYVCYNHILTVPYFNVEKIYMVFNDSGNTNPVVLPNALLQEKVYVNNFINSQSTRTYITTAICQGKSYAGYTTSGTYIDTLASYANGCDSIRTLYLTVKPVVTTNITTSICQGQNYAGHTTTGSFVDIYTAANGCDSTRNLFLTVKPTFATSVTTAICQGQNYAGHTASGTYVDVYSAANGCDSTRTLHLTVKPNIGTTVSKAICQGQSFLGYSNSGTYVDVFVAANGCDSTRTLVLDVKPTVSTTITTAICLGQNYAGYTTSGTYVDVLTAINGCDSTRTLILTVLPTPKTTVTTAICQGEDYAGHTTTGTYVDVYPAANGCDSTRTLHLTVKPVVSTNVATTICEGYNYAGHIIAGTYIDVYKAINGCDSTRTLQLTVNPKKYTTVPISLCQGQTYFAAGHWQATTGAYLDTLRTYLGCDSIITTDIIVHPLPVPKLGPDRGLCIGDTMVLNPGNFTSYLWQDGSTDSTFKTNILGIFWVKVTTAFGCVAADTVKLIKLLPLPADFLPADTSLCRGNIVHVQVDGYKTYNWSTGSTRSFIDITKTDQYSLQVHDLFGCVGKDSMRVSFYNCINIQVPNAFTPNADGKNDVFRPYIPAPVTNYHMQVWNRYGQLLFDTKTYTKGWDGMCNGAYQPAAAYVYAITLIDVDGQPVEKHGTFILVR